MWSAILPFWPVLRDFARNIWYLRLFLIILLIVLLASSGVLTLAEGGNLDPNETGGCLWCQALVITLNDVFLGLAVRFTPVTFWGNAAGLVNSFIRYLFLGILIWVIEQSLSDHRLKKAKYLFFPTREDFKKTAERPARPSERIGP